MLPTRDELLAKASTTPAPPVAIEAYWDGDTTGWMVILSLVYHKRSLFRKRYYDYELGRLRGSDGDFRLFRGNVPPWPEAALASEVGQELAEHFGVPFYFASPDHPEDECPHWWERELGHTCRDCDVLLLQSEECPWRGLCYHCHLAEVRSQDEPSNSMPNSERESTDKMPVGLGVVLVYMCLTGIAAVFGAAIYPSHFIFYFGYGIACLIAIVGSLSRSKSAWYLLIVLLSLYLVIYANTLSVALMSSSIDASDQLIAKKIIQIIPLAVALYYLFTPKARAYLNVPGSSPGKKARTSSEEDWFNVAFRYPPSSEEALFIGKDSPAKIFSVTEDVVHYVDRQNNAHKIDLHACVTLGDEQFGFGTAENYVAARQMDGRPPFVTFFDSTRMEFDSWELAYSSLIGELARHGWRTVDFS